MARREIFRTKTVSTIVRTNSVAIESYDKLEIIIKYYSNYDLVVSRDTRDMYLSGIPMRKSVAVEIKRKFRQMYTKQNDYQLNY